MKYSLVPYTSCMNVNNNFRLIFKLKGNLDWVSDSAYSDEISRGQQPYFCLQYYYKHLLLASHFCLSWLTNRLRCLAKALKCRYINREWPIYLYIDMKRSNLSNFIVIYLFFNRRIIQVTHSKYFDVCRFLEYVVT